MPSPAVSDDVLNRLRKYDTPTVCNVLELFEIRPRNTGYTDDRIKACYPALPPMVGFATTATFRAGAPPNGQCDASRPSLPSHNRSRSGSLESNEDLR